MSIYESFWETPNEHNRSHWIAQLIDCMGLVEINFKSTGDAQELIVLDEEKLWALREWLIQDPDRFNQIFDRSNRKFEESFDDDGYESKMLYKDGKTFHKLWKDAKWYLLYKQN